MRVASALELAIVADDLTGAMDAAAPFAQRGARCQVLADAGAAVPDTAAVVAASTGSRHLSAERAAARVGVALAGLLQRRPRLLFKKLDSTLRGNVVSETLAALAASGRRHAVIAPAVPAQGRTMRGGRVYVDGIVLADSAAGRDPLSPALALPLAEALRRAAPGLSVHQLGPDDDLVLGHGASPEVHVVDCVSHMDLERIVDRLLPCADRVLLVGAAGLARALAERAFCEAPACPPVVAAAGPVLAAVGSRTPQSDAQVERLRRDGRALILAAPDGRLDLDAALRAVSQSASPAVLIHARPGAGSDAARVAGSLAGLTAALAARLAAGALVATGGDTAQALLAALAAPTIEVRGEILPGAVLGTISCLGRRLPLVTKAGGSGDERLLLDIFRLLEGQCRTRAG